MIEESFMDEERTRHYNDQDKEIADRLREVREADRRSKSDFAKAVGLTRQAYARFEAYQARVMGSHIVRIARYYKIPVEEFFPEDSRDFSSKKSPKRK